MARCFAFTMSLFMLSIATSTSDEWGCSLSHIGNWFSESSVEFNCEQFKDEIDQCCVALDKCYDDQEGRQWCDDQLCDCLEDAVTAVDACKTYHIPAFCEAARSFGQNAYEEAARAKAILLEEEATVIEEDVMDSTNSAIIAMANNYASLIFGFMLRVCILI